LAQLTLALRSGARGCEHRQSSRVPAAVAAAAPCSVPEKRLFFVPQQTEIPAQRNAKIQKVPAVPQVGGVVFLLVGVLRAVATEEELIGRPSQDSASQWKCDTSTRGGCENCNSC